jgi:hypothetical protein
MDGSAPGWTLKCCFTGSTGSVEQMAQARTDYTKGLLRSSPKAVPTSLSMYVPFAVERSMQRLFGAFPNRGAGVALVILRLTVAAALVSGARFCPGPEAEVLLALSRIAAVLIVVGWYTPLAAASGVLVSLFTFWVCRQPGLNALMIATLIAISLLGAGAYSVDARLYGRRRLVVGRPRA